MPYQIYLQLILIALLLAAASYDLVQRRIPNLLLLPGLICALSLPLLAGNPWAATATGLAGFGTGFLVFLPLYLLRGMAAGDVKLMATVGAFCGPDITFQICLATFCIGGVLALLIILVKRRTGAAAANMRALLRPFVYRLTGMALAPEPAPHPSVGNLPYAVAIALGTFVVLYLRAS